MIWDPFVLVVALIFWVLRLVFRAIIGSPARLSVFRHGRNVLMELVSRRGGYMQEARSRLLYTDASGKARLEIGYGFHPEIRISADRSVPFSGVLHRVPRLGYAFLDGLSPDSVPPFYSPSNQLVRQLRTNERIISVLQRLGSYGFSVGFDARGVRAWRRLRGFVPQETRLIELIELMEELASACAMPNAAKVHPVPSEVHCAYCKEAIAPAPDVIYCRECGTPHHRECFALNGRCSVFGCVPPRAGAPVGQVVY